MTWNIKVKIIMNILDLFSGCGGLTEGFRSDFFEIMCHIEMDENACNSLKTREAYYFLNENDQIGIYESYLNGEIDRNELYSYIPNALLDKIINSTISYETINPLIDEINKLKGNSRIDGIIGGPPCQAYSTIGRARNENKKERDNRIYLYKYYSYFLEYYSPKFFIFENVKGLLSYKDQFDEKLLPKIIEEFESLNYDVHFKIINSADYGVPQKRERLFIFGIKQDEGINAELFFDNLSLKRGEVITLRELFNDLPVLHSGETVNEYNNSQPNDFVQRYIRNENDILTQNISRINNDRDKQIYHHVSLAKSNGINLKYNELPKNLKSHKNDTHFIDRFKSLDFNDVSHTLVAHISKDGHYYIHPDINQNRSITVREAARIQTFPDNFYFESSRTAAFRQIGNAVPVVLSKKIASAIEEIFAAN